ncbi:MAG: DNA-directed RNA polymerase subunit alpha [Candidatus Zambryskibacteria bacterium RIFCSPHIGHO2_01_FULL_43_25]|uniref:DNA-directed RNA polymerase subunit alpha n=1 Tax=Candidatus Zambryskibacteria bacterium RIFCSPLOWO2_01_FULL_45_21 TaxID=1802761 RepID=A0A1G2U6T5_9BACT|nr:MAG: DNA-directed RNA polymerase subunit alpha [Candidatus Zambryskibacteria bacterium RIFCSPHIGHO2_01_FULL_43_25]OHB00568.1 MAG: DNA-directed RNA polymerase subunit alpha [Candidatus Zambryskibacteria bacterium RIFCSPHIGHO2_12_FULL_44_12b]OHB04720.1 MAG: DNA-directed RNA polymerase subunit alpha [Candidatus Zambryskibacteria bacterium RIFCSPLOWO2_01_FULL_45_21]
MVLPSKPKIVSEDNFTGVYEIDGLYPGYGHTLGNSLRRIILSSLPGAAIISVKIPGINHEFSIIPGVKEDVITIMLNLKKIRLKVYTQEPQILKLKVKGAKEVTAGDIELPGQVEVLNPELVIASITDKNAELNMEMTAEKGMGYVSRDTLQKNRVDIGIIALDAIFTPIRRASYEVENMRVGDRTDFNRLKIFIETDGTISPKEALESSIEIMINQLKSIIGFKEEEIPTKEGVAETREDSVSPTEIDPEFLKTRIESMGLSARTFNALSNANIRTVGGLARKKEKDLLEIDGLGAKGIQEIKDTLGGYGITLK